MTCPQIYINGQHIEYVTSAKNLGLWIDNTLSWEIHVSKTVSNNSILNSILFSLKMNKHALSFNVRKHLVEALTFPDYDYNYDFLVNLYFYLLFFHSIKKFHQYLNIIFTK